MSRSINFSKTSNQKIEKFLKGKNLTDTNFADTFYNNVLKEVKIIKDCSEKSIVDFYIGVSSKLIDSGKYDDICSKEFWEELRTTVRKKLVDKYVSKQLFDNNIDIYFNEVKREYILHPMGESEEMIFVPENRDIFIKNNLKLVIDCAKRYQNLGFPFEDLIQAGNEGLLMAFDKFDSDRANLRISIINDIESSDLDQFSYDDAEDLIKRNFQYSKTLDVTLKKLPENGFNSKQEFIDWAQINIKKASFSSIAFAWIRAMIICQLNKLAKVIRIPKTSKEDDSSSYTIIRLDSMNPHTNDYYHDNQISEIANDEFAIEDETMQNMEKQNLFKGIVEKILVNLEPFDRRVIKKRFGIGVPFQLSISELAENEGVPQNKIKSSIQNSLKIIAASISPKDRECIIDLLS